MRIIAAFAALVIVAAPAVSVAQQVTVVGKKNNLREDREDKISCKSYPVTGQLARAKKVCMSASDWRQQRAEIQSIGSDKTTSCTSPGGCN